MPLWEWKPYFINYAYWHKKDKFQLKQDHYVDWVMFAIEEGTFRYQIEENVGTAVFGDAVLCPQGMMFEREVLEPVSFHFITLGWHAGPLPDSELLPDFDRLKEAGADALTIMPSTFKATPIQSALAPGSAPPVKLAFADHNRLSSTYFYMHQLSRLPDEHRVMLWNHYLNDLWQQHSVERGFSQLENEHLDKDPRIVEAARWMQQHAFGSVMLKELSASHGFSAVQFTRKFQVAYGTTPIDYLTSLRIQEAQTLLLETEMTLDQIAERCGYENGFYLSRVFSKKMKISPSQYRKTHRM